ncbi:unnamed protein product [Gongylonema pulchrum]|uniref:C2H2-type domain-containing protein n=1 Tax=Gongylonema pulchrum TaxID=637853 RepID=A0A3P7RGW1_9BILA|nr:unnamed protein product [Gongylonema pulchrum]
MVFSNLQELQRHYVDKHVTALYRCNICDQTFNNLQRFQIYLYKNAAQCLLGIPRFESCCVSSTLPYSFPVLARWNIDINYDVH